MARLVWSPLAREDLHHIRRFIGQNSPKYADIVALRIISAVERLQQFPLSGRSVPEKEELNLREIFVYQYRIMYRVEGDDVRIVTIHHGARLLGELPDVD